MENLWRDRFSWFHDMCAALNAPRAVHATAITVDFYDRRSCRAAPTNAVGIRIGDTRAILRSELGVHAVGQW